MAESCTNETNVFKKDFIAIVIKGMLVSPGEM